jgi:hypothetical protein
VCHHLGGPPAITLSFVVGRIYNVTICDCSLILPSWDFVTNPVPLLVPEY